MFLQKNGSDSELKELWFVFSIVFAAYSIGGGLLWSLLMQSEYASLPGLIIGHLVFLFLLYRTAYKHPGTRMLTCFIILRCLGLLRTLGFFSMVKNHPYPIVYFATIVVDCFMIIVWIVLSFKLRKTNIRLQANQKI